MKLMALLMLLMASFAVQAGCYENLLKGSTSSQLHQIDLLNIDYTSLETIAPQALYTLHVKLGCLENDIASIKCALIIADKPDSEACYAETSFGYFIITKDYSEKINLLFTRWD